VSEAPTPPPPAATELPRPSRQRLPWWAAVFLLALACRLGVLWYAHEPLLFGHQAHYFQSGLWLAEQPSLTGAVLKTTSWHDWRDVWTLPPLYPMFLALTFRVAGPHLAVVQIVQCLFGAFASVLVAGIGRAASPRLGVWAGVAYAVYWSAVIDPGHTMTENLHTVLLLAGLYLLLRGHDRRRLALAGGFLIGLSALARAVSTLFVPLAGLWHATTATSPRRWRAGLLVAAAGAVAIVPWTIRNLAFVDEPVLIESVSIYNLWRDNSFMDEDRLARQEQLIEKQPTVAGRRARALHYAWRGVTRHPGAFARKIWDNLLYLFRPVNLHGLLVGEWQQPGWKDVGSVLLDDGMMLAVLPLFLAFVAAGRPSPARRLILFWTAYYLFFLVVVFHVETRYRSALLPLLLAGAPAGFEALTPRAAGRVWRARSAALGGVLAVAYLLGPYASPAVQRLSSGAAVREMHAALDRGDSAGAAAAVRHAAERDPTAAGPWIEYGRRLAGQGRWEEAITAYREAAARRPHVWVGQVVLPGLLARAGRETEAAQALQDAHRLYWSLDPWLALEAAWQHLPPPAADEIHLGRDDYGAVRGFFHPRGDHRWSHCHAELRLAPTVGAGEYEVTLWMGSPEPSPLAAPAVRVTAGGTSVGFTLGRDIKPYAFRARSVEGVVHVELAAPTWNRSDQPPDQGIRVDRLSLRPAASAAGDATPGRVARRAGLTENGRADAPDRMVIR
jgi:4-amino-4-deoxy-L-arabinose transferase-like glycosyltransferase